MCLQGMDSQTQVKVSKQFRSKAWVGRNQGRPENMQRAEVSCFHQGLCILGIKSKDI